MIYYCGNEKIDLAESSFKVLKNPYCEKTIEGISYKKGDFVYKIYYNYENPRCEEVMIFLDEKSCIKLTTISNLKHIFLPIGIIHDENNKYAGCKAEFIKPLAKGCKRIIEKPVTTFFDEISEVQSDLQILSENRVLVGDFGIHNMIDNGHINIFDAGGYEVDFEKKYSIRKIQNTQFNELNLLLTELVEEEIKRICDEDSFYINAMYLRDLSRKTSFLQMLEKEATSYNSIMEFTKDICKTRVKKR